MDRDTEQEVIRRAYTNTEIAAKIDFTADYIAAICYLLEHGRSVSSSPSNVV